MAETFFRFVCRQISTWMATFTKLKVALNDRWTFIQIQNTPRINTIIIIAAINMCMYVPIVGTVEDDQMIKFVEDVIRWISQKPECARSGQFQHRDFLYYVCKECRPLLWLSNNSYDNSTLNGGIVPYCTRAIEPINLVDFFELISSAVHSLHHTRGWPAVTETLFPDFPTRWWKFSSHYAMFIWWRCSVFFFLCI